MRIGLVRVAALVIATTAACDDTTASGTVDDLADVVCGLTFDCCDRGEVDFFLGPFVSAENCAERLRRQADLDTAALIAAPFEGAAVPVPNVGVLQKAIDDGRVKIDPGALDACLEFLSGLTCNQLIDEPEPEGCQVPEPEEDPACDLREIVIGQVGAGDTCTSPGASFECKSGLACRAVDSLGIDGVCVEPGDVGDFCFDSGECGEDLYCSLLDGTCQLPRQAGETCLVADGGGVLIACDAGLSCDPITDICVAQCSRGASCSSDLQCDEEAGLRCVVGRCDSPRAVGLPCQISDHCADGLRCGVNPATGSDLVCLELLAEGASCSTAAPEDCATGFCSPVTLTCAPSADPGDLCPTLSQDECAGGYCDVTPRSIACAGDAQCANSSGTCDLVSGVCEAFCIALQPDGAMCVNGFECVSGTCVEGFCRTTPLPDGQPCNFSAECESGFCNHEVASVCEQLPLPNGRVCFSDFECASEVCFNSSCQNGLSEGADCSSLLDPPCARDLFCDRQAETPICTPVLATGEECIDSGQCRGDCTIRFNRRMCDATPPADTAVCDGQ
jgi:hypothetical protein